MKENEKSCYHVPVMLSECLEGLAIRPEGVYVDITFGGGGHSRGILSHLGERGCLYGFDQDADAERNVPDDSRFVFVRSNFRYLYNFMRYHGRLGEVDGLLADLGVSSHHFDDESRGFSFRFDGELDMRMNRRAGRYGFGSYKDSWPSIGYIPRVTPVLHSGHSVLRFGLPVYNKVLLYLRLPSGHMPKSIQREIR